MKRRLLIVILLTLGLLATACRQETPAPAASQRDPTPSAIIETVIVPMTVIVSKTVIVPKTVIIPETVVVVATATPEPERPTPTLTPTTAVAQLTPAPQPSMTPTRPPLTTTPAVVPTATATPTPTGGPAILYFRANTTIADPGQTIQLEWASTAATKASLGHLFDFRMTIDAWDLPPNGVYDYTLRANQRNSITLFLTVIDADDRWASESFTLPLTCPDPWFFSPAPDTCPASPARVSAGAEQRFENGFMLWEAAERRIYVLFDSGSPRWTVITDTWQDGEALCQIEPVPPGRVHPARGFGKAWCNEPGLRDRLGWALSQEVGGYQTAVQSTAYDRYNTLYIRAADGGVWKLLTERSGWEKLPP